MRPHPSILHVDLDAFFASVEQRDKPSLRGKPVIVGGVGGRGVVATASYQARAFGARSAMPTAQARRLCPAGTAFLAPRPAAYRASSEVVMELLRARSPLVEQVGIDEAYLDLAAADLPDLGEATVTAVARRLRADIAAGTGGLTASIGAGSSKLVAKVASDLRKPDALTVVAAGTELAVLHPLPVTRLGGVGPATAERLRTLGVDTVAALAALTEAELVHLVGQAHGSGLYRLARAEDDRPVVAFREAKSVSAEETFPADLTDPAALRRELDLLVAKVAVRLRGAGTAGRTVTLKLRRHDFSTHTRSLTLPQPTDDPRTLTTTAHRLLAELDAADGVRLLGLGVSGLSEFVQDDLFGPTAPAAPATEPGQATEAPRPAGPTAWVPGQDVTHDTHGPGWVWGAGRSVVTVRFEGPTTGPGPVRSFPTGDRALHQAPPPDWHQR